MNDHVPAVPVAAPFAHPTVRPAQAFAPPGVLVGSDAAGACAIDCHILAHAEGPNPRFGMVTALIGRA